MTWDELEAAGPYQDDHHQMVYLEQNNEPMAFGCWTGQEKRGSGTAYENKLLQMVRTSEQHLE